MLPAFLTTIFWSLSAIFAARSARQLGPVLANLGRMTLALAMLGLWAHTLGGGVRGASFGWFFVSGFVGYGLGDLALFQTLPRLGARLTMLLIHCLAVPVAAVAERLWLGTALRPVEIACAAVILSGVCIALTPIRHLNLTRSQFYVGTFFGVCASLGQAFGAVISRKAYLVAAHSDFHIDGGTAAYQRMLGGIVVAGTFSIGVKIFAREKTGAGNSAAPSQHKTLAWLYVALNALAGPALGVACFQWALSIAKSGVVLPIIATTPVVAIPLTFLIDGDRPTLRSVVGGVIAVGGAVAMAVARN
jgi:drug/metabolite transporter (DMT)-like permease